MQITVMIENTGKEGMCAEHGLSLYIEYNGGRYLLDTGATSAFLANADKLGIPLDQVDMAFLSHSHYDHSGGFEGFFQRNSKAKVYLQEKAKEACYKITDDERSYIGIPKHLLAAYPERFCFLEKDFQAARGVWVLPHTTKGLEQRGKRAHMYREREGNFSTDDFAHEQSLVFETEKGLIVLNSCSHGGIVNIVREAEEALGRKVYAVVGGFHLMGTDGIQTMAFTEEEVIGLGRDLLALGVEEIYTGHCTGAPAYEILAENFKGHVHDLAAGTRITFPS